MNATERQPIPVVRDIPARTPEEVRVDADQIERIFEALDASLAAYRLLIKSSGHGLLVTQGRLLVVMAEDFSAADYACRLWASANGCSMREHVSADGQWRIRTLDIVVADQAIAAIQYPAEFVDDVPRVLTNANAAWSPSQGERL